MSFIYYFLSKWDWFYRSVIKEKDEFMLFYYSIFASLMILVLNTWSVGLYVSEYFEIGYFNFSKLKYLLVLPVILLPGFYLAFKNRSKVEEGIVKMKKEKNILLDFISVGIVIGTFAIFYSRVLNLIPPND